jgi:CRP-like cAMP-binding protein
MEHLIHVANALILLSFCLKEILWLRLLSILASLCFVLYFLNLPQPLMAPVVWNSIFAAVNIVQIVRLVLERRPAKLSREEQMLHQLAFSDIDARDFERMVRLADWRSEEAGALLVRQGVQLEELLMLLEGSLSVETGSIGVRSIGLGQFIGEMSYLAGGTPSVDIVASEDARVVVWPGAALRGFLEVRPDLRAAVQLLMGRDLVQKARSM